MLADPRTEAKAFVAGLERIVAPRDHAILIPGSDAALLAISEHRARLEPYVRLGLPPHEAVTACVDKVKLAGAAVRAGLGSPRSRLCTGPDDACAVARRFGYPVVVKPVRSVFGGNGSVRQQGGRRAHDEASLRTLLPEFGNPCLVQASEPGPLYSCSGVTVEGRLAAVAVSRYCRTWPAESGNATSAITVEPPPGLAAKVDALLRDLGWEGIFELELILHPDGRFLVIDLNPRPFGSMSLVIAAGAALPALWCEWLLGTCRPDVTARSGVRYRWEDGELKHALWHLRRRHLRAAASAMAPHRRVVHAHFRRDDPLPLAARVLYLAAPRLRRLDRCRFLRDQETL